MGTFKFANVLMETNPRSLAFPTLYYRTNQPLSQDMGTGEWTLQDAGECDFTTYFNALSVRKLLRYTTATAFHLHLELKGAACTVTQTKAYPLSSGPVLNDGVSTKTAGTGEWENVDLVLDVDEDMVLTAFRLKSSGPVSIRNGYYSLNVSEEPRPIELALATTTFKKEPFITKNIALVKQNILNSKEDIAQHFHMHVVDNGSTLDAAALSDDYVKVYPNENVGGAGGFARGMIAAMEQKVSATNVLLMDDDVEVSPESIIRTYNLLRILKPEYQEAFISGAMLSYEEIQDQWEDTGFIDPNVGNCRPAKPIFRVTDLESVINDEVFELPKDIAQRAKQYAAWWYCCIPMSMIKKNGLPLPFFVRYDDVEYGIRSNPKFITMIGLGIWHSNFHIRYNAAVERYQTTRNGMIAQCTTNIAPNLNVMVRQMTKDMYLELKKFNYADASLLLDGFEDFLKGPRYIAQPIAQQRFMDANKNKEKTVSFDELMDQVKALGITDFNPYKLSRQEIDSDLPRDIMSRLFDYTTCNFQRTIFRHQGDGYAVIPNIGWAYPAGKIHNERIIIVVDWYNKKGSVRVKDISKYDTVIKRYKKDMAYYKRHVEHLQKEYAAARKELTSLEFWKNYLNLK